jgi:DNA-binding NtrC family response regulator
MKSNIRGHILIVDDESEIRDMLSRHFRFLGYQTDTANDGKEALAIMAEKRFDVVISDIMMPIMDGVTLLKHIGEQYPMVRVIMITGYITLENALACMRRHAETCIFKPLNDLLELEKAVQHAVETLDNWNQKFHELKGMDPNNEVERHG